MHSAGRSVEKRRWRPQRRRPKADRRVNLKAEPEIQYLDEKVDMLLAPNAELQRQMDPPNPNEEWLFLNQQ